MAGKEVPEPPVGVGVQGDKRPDLHVLVRTGIIVLLFTVPEGEVAARLADSVAVDDHLVRFPARFIRLEDAVPTGLPALDHQVPRRHILREHPLGDRPPLLEGHHVRLAAGGRTTQRAIPRVPPVAGPQRREAVPEALVDRAVRGPQDRAALPAIARVGQTSRHQLAHESAPPVSGKRPDVGHARHRDRRAVQPNREVVGPVRRNELIVDEGADRPFRAEPPALRFRSCGVPRRDREHVLHHPQVVLEFGLPCTTELDRHQAAGSTTIAFACPASARNASRPRRTSVKMCGRVAATSATVASCATMLGMFGTQ